MYIPVMALVTYILLSTMIAGIHGQFNPEMFGYTATYAFFVVGVEIGILKLGCYLLSISNESQLLDLVAYSGYKFVGVIATIVVSEILNRGEGTGGWVGWTMFAYTFLANALFLVSCPSTLSKENISYVKNLVTVTEICAAARKYERRKRNHANSRKITKKQEDAIPLSILIPCTIRLHVGTHADVVPTIDWRGAS
jgi:hypothetical protein